MVGSQWQAHCRWRARLHQGYLSRPQDGLTVRVRTSEAIDGGEGLQQAWLTLKAPPPAVPEQPDLQELPDQPDRAQRALSRLEFEYAIPLEDGQAMLALTTMRLVKRRHGLDLPGGDWVLDVFEAENAPLVVAEVELEREDQAVPLPDWIGAELTGRRELSNAALAARPLALWSEQERRALLGGLQDGRPSHRRPSHRRPSHGRPLDSSP